MLTNDAAANRSDSSDSCRVSVIIPTLNAGSMLSLLLERLQNQTLKPCEIIVIDSESEDGTAGRAREAGALVKMVKRSEFDHGGTRNRAAAEAKGDILLFMTQDAMPDDLRLIEELVKPLRVPQSGTSAAANSNKVAYCYARQLPHSEADVLERLARLHNYPEQSHIRSYEQIEEFGIKTFFCSNVCSAIRREVFEQMGRFQEPVIFNEDLFMAAKCILSGYRVAYCAEARVIHSHNYTAAQQFKRYFDNGVSMRLNEWIRPYSAVGAAGSKLVRLQLKGLAEKRQWHRIPGLIMESAAKLLGFKLGLHYTSLPKPVIRRISMHPLIWSQLEPRGGRSEASDSVKDTINHT